VTDTGVDGVFLAGDWVGPTGLLADAALASGRAAALGALRRSRSRGGLRAAPGGPANLESPPSSSVPRLAG